MLDSIAPVIGPIIGGVTTIVVGAFVGIYLQKRKEAHEIRLKEVDIQQKREDHERTKQLDEFKRKAQAAETIVKKWTLVLERLRLLESFYKSFSNPYKLKDFIIPMTTQFTEEMTKWEARANTDGIDDPDLFYLYFSSDLSNSDFAKTNYESIINALDLVEVHRHQLLMLLDDAIQISARANNTDDEAEAEKLALEYQEKNNMITLKVQTILEYIGFHVNVIEKACQALKREMSIA